MTTSVPSTCRFSRRSCARCARARRCSDSAARERRARPRALPAAVRAPRSARASAAREALGVERVHHHGVDVHAHLLAQPAAELDRLVHRHLLRQRHRHHAGALGSVMKASIWPAWRAIGPTRAMSPNVRGVRSIAEPVAGGRGVQDHQVVGRVRRLRRSSCASSQTLPIVASSRTPGAAAAKYSKIRLWNSRPASALEPTWSLRYSSSASLRVDRDRPEVLGQLGLGVAHALACGRRATCAPGCETSHTIVRLPRARGGEPEGRRDGGLAHAALAGDDHQALVE